MARGSLPQGVVAAALDSLYRVPKASTSAEPTAFASLPNPTRGRTREGDSCTCTDPPPPPVKDSGPKGGSEESVGGVLQTLGLKKPTPSDDHNQVADEFAKQQRAAAVYNADAAIEKPAQDFADARGEFDKAYEDAKLKFEVYKDQRKKYEVAYNNSMALHKQHCKQFVDDHFQIPLDCEKRRQKEAGRFLARIRHPECMVGEKISLDAPSEAAMPVDPLVLTLACSRRHVGALPGRASHRASRNERVSASFL